jgi:Flp pilus assembly protein TadD/4-amino-4-deoxy-L-arabinose transferase-like glycosyltransferase
MAADKKSDKGKKRKKAPPSKQKRGWSFMSFWDDASEDRISDTVTMLIVFAVALALRLTYLVDFREVPYFHHPVGDSLVYHARALAIVAGDWIGREAYFHSSPLYPYFLALVYKIFGVNFTALIVVQFVIGSVTCVLIYLLARRAAPRSTSAPALAGFGAAAYRTLVFMDGEVLMETLVLFFSCASILLMTFLKPPGEDEEGTAWRGWRRFLAAWGAGVLLGLAGLGRPNILVFAPFAAVWIVTGFRWSFSARGIPAAVLFALGCVLAVAPITLRNYAVSKDFVLVSSNAGVNFYIGNNETAEGIYALPPNSGLDNTRLYLSSREAAEAATGRSNMKPSEVSRYWASQGWKFIKEQPGKAAGLWWRKFRLFWNWYEVPNHLNQYFVARTYALFLFFLVVKFTLAASLAIMAVFLFIASRRTWPIFRLYVGFVLVYMVFLLPFFVTERYRLPVVPFLVVLAALGVWHLWEAGRRRRWRRVGIAVAIALVVAVFVSRPMLNYDFGFDHVVMGCVYSDLATEKPDNAADLIQKAIVEFKTGIELRPLSVDGHYNLGVAYERIGYYSGAVRELEMAAALQPTHPSASKALASARDSLEQAGDRIDAAALPRTRFEIAGEYTKRGLADQAELMYGQVLRVDPHHASTYNQLGSINFDRGDYREAIRFFAKGLRYSPDHFVLHNNIAGAYFKVGDKKQARRHWEKCLELDPGNESVLRQLRLLENS